MSNKLSAVPHTYTDNDEPDLRAGHYYVSCVDGGRFSLLYGPCDRHADALALVETVQRAAEKIDSWACFYSFGTCRLENYSKPGVLNETIGGLR